MPDDCALYDHLADLLDYPRPGYVAKLEACHRAVAEAHPDSTGKLAALLEQAREWSVERAQELFSRTFELNPLCSPEVGWHLFGENYERGTFLVWMRVQLRHFGLAESTELPDHLTHVLPVLGRLEPAEANEFSATCVLPALQRMLDSLKDKQNPYENALHVIADVLRARHGASRANAIPLPILRQYDDALVLLDGR